MILRDSGWIEQYKKWTLEFLYERVKELSDPNGFYHRGFSQKYREHHLDLCFAELTRRHSDT